MNKMIIPVAVFTLLVFAFVALVTAVFLPKAPAPQVDPAPKVYTDALPAPGGQVTSTSIYQSVLDDVIYLVRISIPKEFKTYVYAVYTGESFSFSASPANNTCHDPRQCGYA